MRRMRLAPALAWALILLAAVPPAAGTAARPAYRMVATRGRGTLAALRAELGLERFASVLRLNRVDADHAARLDSLVVPIGDPGDSALSPFPAARADTAARRLLISLRVQAFAAYERGRQVRRGPISSGGAANPTAAGAYFATWKTERHVSTVDSTWIMPWCVNLDSREGLALHEYSMPGRPPSHCCIRLLAADARWIYDWIETWEVAADGRRVLRPGTPVRVFGAYDFDAPPPWRRLPADPGAADSGGEAEAAAPGSSS